MRSRNKNFTVISIILTIITLAAFWIFSKIFREPSIFKLSIPFAFSTFVFSSILVNRNGKKWSVEIKNAQTLKILLNIMTVTSVLAVLFVPSYNSSIIQPTNIPVLNWIRYLSSILLVLFLPGYFLLKIFSTQNPIKLFPTILLSYSVSMFISFLTGFGLLLAYNSISSQASYLLAVVNLVLMCIYDVFCSKTSLVIDINPIQLGALLTTILVIMVGNLYLMSNTFPLMSGDMSRLHEMALQYSKGFPVHGGRLIPSYPYFFLVFLATFFQLAGLSSMFSYQIMFILSFIVALSFYVVLKEWFPKGRLSSFAILLTPLLGFGSLYALDLKLHNEGMALFSVLWNSIRRTYDILYVDIVGASLANIVPVFFIELPTLFVFIYLLRKKLKSAVRIPLLSVIVAASFLGHISGSFFMGTILCLYAIIVKGESVRDGVFGGVLGLFLVLIADISTPVGHYILITRNPNQNNLFAFLATLVLFISSYAISVILKKDLHIIREILSKCLKKIHLIRWPITYAYFFLIICWVHIVPNYDAAKFGWYNYTPFFIWPIRFGPIGLLFVLSLFLYMKEIINNKDLLFFFAIASIGFVFEQISNYLPLFYIPSRFATLTWIGVLVIDAYGIVKISQSLSSNKKILLTAILLIVIIPGMLTSSLHYAGKALMNKPEITNNELEALSFIRTNLPSNSTFITFTEDSANKLETFGGIHQLQTMLTWEYLLTKTQDPTILLHVLGRSNVRYLYLSNKDLNIASQSGIISCFISDLSIVFMNDEITIYKLPQLTPPSLSADFVVFDFFNVTQPSKVNPNIMLYLSLPSRFGLNYQIFSLPLGSKQELYDFTWMDNMEEVMQIVEEAEVIMLPLDPEFNANGLIRWTEEGGSLLLLSDEKRIAFFGEELGLKKGDESLLVDEITFEDLGEKVLLPTCKVSQISVEDSKTRVLASFKATNNDTSPFLLYREMEEGQILYVRLPTCSTNQNEIVVTLFNNVLKSTSMLVQESQDKLEDLPLYQTLEKKTFLNGLININTNHLISAPIKVKQLEIQTDKTSEKIFNTTIYLKSFGNTLLSLNGSAEILSELPSSYLTMLGNIAQRYYLEVENSYLEITILDQDRTLLITEGSIVFDSWNFNILIRKPIIEVVGQIDFESARIASSLNPPSYTSLGGVVRGQMRIMGRTRFNILYASTDIMLISEFDFDGKVEGIDDDQPYEELDIPWANILFSPVNMLLMIFVAIGAFINIRYKKVIIKIGRKRISLLVGK